MPGGYLDFPFGVDASGATATVGEDGHVRDLIMQVLFTNPGERVNRPEFGCGLRSLVFLPNSSALAAATQALVKGALQTWLEREIQVEAVQIEQRDERLEVVVAYRRRATGERRVDRFGVPEAAT
jgi:phage baseplate assembly protein W